MTSPSASFAPSNDVSLPAFSFAPSMHPRALIVVCVVAVHALGLWAMQAGLGRKAIEQVVPVEVVIEFIELPIPVIAPAPAAAEMPAPAPAAVAPRPTVTPKAIPKPAPKPVPKQAPAPKPVASAPSPEPTPSPQPTAVLPEAAPAPINQPPTNTHSTQVSKAPQVQAPPAPPAPPKLELPSSDARYLNNPRPPYPPMSKRLGEQGKVVIRALIGVDGAASNATVHTSSGYQRLDKTALSTVEKWRYVPGKRDGVPLAMWFNIPVSFELE